MIKFFNLDKSLSFFDFLHKTSPPTENMMEPQSTHTIGSEFLGIRAEAFLLIGITVAVFLLLKYSYRRRSDDKSSIQTQLREQDVESHTSFLHSSLPLLSSPSCVTITI